MLQIEISCDLKGAKARSLMKDIQELAEARTPEEKDALLSGIQEKMHEILCLQENVRVPSVLEDTLRREFIGKLPTTFLLLNVFDGFCSTYVLLGEKMKVLSMLLREALQEMKRVT